MTEGEAEATLRQLLRDRRLYPVEREALELVLAKVGEYRAEMLRLAAAAAEPEEDENFCPCGSRIGHYEECEAREAVRASRAKGKGQDAT